jgi:hypothetical protein
MKQGNCIPDRFGCRGGLARRYHWLSFDAEEFVQPNQRVCCDRSFEKVLDLTAHESEETRKASLDIVKDGLKELSMPNRHEILEKDLTERDMSVLKKAYELQPSSYEELVSLEGMGAKKIRALALISDLVYGTESSWKDPVKYSFAHGGKDGIPYPVDRSVYDSSIQYLENALELAEIEKKDKCNAIKRLHEFVN